MIHVGIAGIGFMGMIHYLTYQKARGVKLLALCEQDPKRLAGDWRSIRGNFGPRGQVMDLSGVTQYPRLEDLLADPRLDVIDICLPPAMHAPVTIAALKAGKHAFCEKPIALQPKEAQRMVAAAAAAKRMLMIGHVLPFFPEYAFALKAIRGGQHGRLLGGQFKRMVSDPLWLPDFYDPTKVGGPMIDLHVHDAHFIRLVCGMPAAVQSVGRMRGEVVEQFSTQFLFDDPSLVVTAMSGVINQQGRAFTHGFEIHLEQATLVFEFSTIGGKPCLSMPLTVFDARGRAVRPKLRGGDPMEAFAGEIAEMVRAVRSGEPSAPLSGDVARDALVLCQRQTESVLRRRAVRV
ncbi:MAG: Gfo/Idh/MocA family protein [Planctomycetota bacterium]